MDVSYFREIGRQAVALKPSNSKASQVFLSSSLLTMSSLYLSSHDHLGVWFLGQLIYSVACFHWFVILHDCGHDSFFKRKWLNNISGHMASLFCLVPYHPWKMIHSLHHKWTGWKDLDPTTKMLSKPQNNFVKKVMDIGWKLWFPICSLSFSLGNFWNVKKCNSLATDYQGRRNCFFSVLFVGLFYAVLWSFIGNTVFRYFVAGHFIFLVISDPMIVSQHGHLDSKDSQNENVKAHTVFEQDVFTRELEFPNWVENLIFMNFNRHLTHHFWPSVPCYFLHKIDYTNEQKVPWHKWLKQMKSMKGSDVLLKTKSETGAQY